MQLEAAVQGDQAAIDNATVQLGYTTIASPISGRTGIRLVDRGNIVRATAANGLVIITQVQPISVVFGLPQDALGEITRELSQGPLKVLAYNRDGTTRLGEGILALIDNQVDVEPGVRQERFVTSLRRLCLCKLRLKRTWINLRQHVAFVDVLTLDKRHPVQVSVDPHLYRDDIERTDNSDTIKVHRYILALHHSCLHRNARSGRSLRRRDGRLLPPKMPPGATSRR